MLDENFYVEANKQTNGYFIPGNECNDPNSICISNDNLKKLTGQKDIPKNPDAIKKIIDQLKSKSNCKSQSCVLERNNLEAVDNNGKQLMMKPKGPANSNEWLDNFNIELTFDNLERIFPNFHYFKCELRDFMSAGSRNDENDIHNIYKYSPYPTDKLNCFAIILNTALTGSPGEHWVSLFYDFRNRPWEINFFDSANQNYNKILPIIKQSIAVIEHNGVKEGIEHDVIVKFNVVGHQRGGSECGVYSLFFCCARLFGYSFDEFNKSDQIFKDDEIEKLRKSLFIS